jgi:hypothetical protein
VRRAQQLRHGRDWSTEKLKARYITALSPGTSLHCCPRALSASPAKQRHSQVQLLLQSWPQSGPRPPLPHLPRTLYLPTPAAKNQGMWLSVPRRAEGVEEADGLCQCLLSASMAGTIRDRKRGQEVSFSALQTCPLSQGTRVIVPQKQHVLFLDSSLWDNFQESG